MALSKGDIIFIDRYLLNSGVEFLDIRMEMIDHIASAIETHIKNGDKRSFYDIFKAYMLTHKQDLLQSNKKFLGVAMRRVGRRVWSQIKSVKTIAILSLILGTVLLSSTLLNATHFYNLLKYSAVLILSITVLCYFIVNSKQKGFRNSSLERLGIYFTIFVVILSIIWSVNDAFIQKNLLISILFTTLVTFLIGVLLATMFAIKKDIKAKYYA